MADRVLDYSSGFPGAASIKAAGYRGAVRYVGLPGNPKNTTRQELLDFEAHDLGMALVFERLTTDWTMGYAGGQTFGRQARDHANAIGFPADRPIYMAVDQQVTGAAAHDTAMAYLHGASSVLGGKALTGVYGQASVADRARNEGFGYRWQTKAWSGGVVASGIHLLQNIGYVGVGGVQCDTNDVYQDDWGQHGGNTMLTEAEYQEIAKRVGNEIKDKVLNTLDDTRVIFLGPDRNPDGTPVKRSLMDGLRQGNLWAVEAIDAARASGVALTDEQVSAIARQTADHLESTLGGEFDVTITRKTTP